VISGGCGDWAGTRRRTPRRGSRSRQERLHHESHVQRKEGKPESSCGGGRRLPASTRGRRHQCYPLDDRRATASLTKRSRSTTGMNASPARNSSPTLLARPQPTSSGAIVRSCRWVGDPQSMMAARTDKVGRSSRAETGWTGDGGLISMVRIWSSTAAGSSAARLARAAVQVLESIDGPGTAFLIATGSAERPRARSVSRVKGGILWGLILTASLPQLLYLRCGGRRLGLSCQAGSPQGLAR
jgi:hypothetical protein